MNVGDPFFNKLGATITERTFCDSGACTGYMMTVGPTPGTDPESFVHSRYIVLWACNTISTNMHHWPIIAEAQKRGAKLVVIDPVKHAHRTPGRLAHPHQAGHRRGARHGDDERHHQRRSGRQGLRRELHRRLRRAQARVQAYSPEKVAAITGIPAQDIRTLAREYATTRPSRDPHRRRGRAPFRRRPDRARRRLPAGAGRRLARRRRRHPAASHLGLPGQVGEPDAPGLDQARNARAKSVEARRRAHRRSEARSADPVAVRLQRQPGGGRAGAGQRSSAGSSAKICSRW